MAAGSLLMLIDDIASVLDDVATLTHVAAKKTAGVLGDDLALNAQQVTGVSADRELPVVWAVAKGSFINKLILVPAALALSVFVPWLITPLLIIGGLFLCYEGAEKVLHKFLSSEKSLHQADQAKIDEAKVVTDLAEFEQQKVKGAIRTDFILSAEIIVIALGTVTDQAFAIQAAVVSGIALIMTIGVYGLVAGIVKIDDMGLHLMQTNEQNSLRYTVGSALLRSCPYLMKTLSVLGTFAMFLVGGGILMHGIPALHHIFEEWLYTIHLNSIMHILIENSLILILGFIAGLVLVCLASFIERLKHKQ